MPVVTVSTNVTLSADQSQRILTELTEFVVRELNKPKAYVQAQIQGGCQMQFNGTSDRCAFVELRAVNFPKDRAGVLTDQLTQLLKNHLQLQSDRVFINFLDVPPQLWGWNGATLA